MSDIFKHAYSLINPEQKKKEWYEELEEKACAYCPALSFQQRIIGSVCCLTIGLLISLGSTVRLIDLMKGNPMPFAVAYTFGNIVGICSTCFMYGPWSQFKKMFAPTRLIATGLYLFFMGVTLFLAFYPNDIPGRLLWLLISILLQFLALIWYTMSFIPYAREIIISCCKASCCKSLIPQEEDASFFGGL